MDFLEKCPKDDSKICYFLKEKEDLENELTSLQNDLKDITVAMQLLMRKLEDIDPDVELKNGVTKTVKQRDAIVLTWENQNTTMAHLEQIDKRTKILEEIQNLVDYTRKIGRILKPVFKFFKMVIVTAVIIFALYLLIVGRMKIEDIISNLFQL